jgi:hypothetical protein
MSSHEYKVTTAPPLRDSRDVRLPARVVSKIKGTPEALLIMFPTNSADF